MRWFSAVELAGFDAVMEDRNEPASVLIPAMDMELWLKSNPVGKFETKISLAKVDWMESLPNSPFFQYETAGRLMVGDWGS